MIGCPRVKADMSLPSVVITRTPLKHCLAPVKAGIRMNAACVDAYNHINFTDICPP